MKTELKSLAKRIGADLVGIASQAALASGIGRLGWSGNLLTREYGALVELGSILTSATLTADKPLPDEDHPRRGWWCHPRSCQEKIPNPEHGPANFPWIVK